jgi:hypothetical protein
VKPSARARDTARFQAVSEDLLIIDEINHGGLTRAVPWRRQVDELSFSVTGGDYVDGSGVAVTNEYTLNYNNLFTLAIGAIKEQQVVIEGLKALVGALDTVS